MKKGIVFAFAIALMVLFVGCGIQNQLSGTAWGDANYKSSYELYKKSGAPASTVSGTYYEFISDGSYNTYDKDLLSSDSGQLPGMQIPDRYYESIYPSGTWFCEGHELHMKLNGSSVGIIYNASISGDTLTLEDKSGSAYMELYRIK